MSTACFYSLLKAGVYLSISLYFSLKLDILTCLIEGVWPSVSAAQ
jgi:hypothetical protein